MAFEYIGEIIGKVDRKYVLAVSFGDVAHVDFPANMKIVRYHEFPECGVSKEFQVDDWAKAWLQHYKDIYSYRVSDGVFGNTYDYADLT